MPRITPVRELPRAILRTILSSYVLTGVSAGFGLMLIAGSAYLLIGPYAGSVAAVGAIVCIPTDHAAPRRGKFLTLLPTALIGLPLFASMQAVQEDPLWLGLLLVPATFCAFLAGAWGKRGLPIVISIMFSMIFSMAVAAHPQSAGFLSTCLYFALGSALYIVYSTLANIGLNSRYRAQILAEALLSLSTMMHTQARRFVPADALGQLPVLPGQLMQQQAALADQLQAARDLILESPRTPRRQQLAAMLLRSLEIRDHLLASELDLDTLRSVPGHAPVFHQLRELLMEQAQAVEAIADALLTGRQPRRFADQRPQLARLGGELEEEMAPGPMPPATAMSRAIGNRIGNISDEVLHLNGLARGETAPDLTVVRTAWQLFVSPTSWSWKPFTMLWHWDAPPLRHAIRAALAVGTAYLIALALPWATHDYWILLAVVVVLRGSLAHTLERRNSRVAGTALGCVLAAVILSTQAPALLLLVIVPVAQAISHSFAIKRYLITAVSATVLSLVQAHLLSGGMAPAINVFERLADTLIGTGIAWAFSYVLPSWERNQIPALVARTMAAQARHARTALNLGQLEAVDDEPELEWRLARREAYDSLSALVQATRRSLSEPRAVRPPLEALESLLIHGHNLLAQLAVVKTMLMRRRNMDQEPTREPLQRASAIIESLLTASEPQSPANAPSITNWPTDLPQTDPFGYDLSPWIVRRLDLACNLAAQLRDDADRVLQARAEAETEKGAQQA
ncbi:FUSC family membrane protein [Pseudomonas sp. OIL-1]|uniref:FUSC family protein n=1 Tax=Pseudomonas sp. OIL-1 TaxID=2706126 RepID=UPI001C499E9D|nr:FUSC family membrane protein [Pseudomonas sp. OIL-1]